MFFITNSPEALDFALSGLFDESIVFTYYNSSGDKNPGTGNKEQIPINKTSDFNDLKKFENWRRKLSNAYTNDDMIIMVGDKSYKSIDEFIKSKNSEKGTTQQALYAKFTSNDQLDMKAILLATKDAKLQAHVHRSPPTLSVDLMQLRKKLMEK